MDYEFLKNNAHPAQVRDKFICQYCGQNGLENPYNYRNSTIDHFIPRQLGGSDDLDNCKTACRYCNSLKGQRRFETVQEVKNYISDRIKEDEEYIRKLKKALEV